MKEFLVKEFLFHIFFDILGWIVCRYRRGFETRKSYDSLRVRRGKGLEPVNLSPDTLLPTFDCHLFFQFYLSSTWSLKIADENLNSVLSI